MHPVKIGVLSSGNGDNLLPLIEAIEEGKLNAHIKLLISDQADSPILDLSREHNIAAWYVSTQGHTSESYDQMLNQLLTDHHVELCVVLDFGQALSERFKHQWYQKLLIVPASDPKALIEAIELFNQKKLS